MKLKTIMTASLVAATLVLTGCTTESKSGVVEDPDTVVSFNTDIHYFETLNGNMEKFFSQGNEPTLQAFTDNEQTLAVSEVGTSKRYRLMIKTAPTERPVILLDPAKADTKKCDFTSTISMSYWDMDLSILRQQFEASEDSFFAISKDGRSAYAFTPNKDQKSGAYVAAVLDKNNVLSQVATGVYDGAIDLKSAKLPKLTANNTTKFYGNHVEALPVDLSVDEWKSVVAKLAKLDPKGDEVNFYGITSSGDIMDASFKNDTCSAKSVN